MTTYSDWVHSVDSKGTRFTLISLHDGHMVPHWTCKDLHPLGSKKEIHGLQPGAIVRGASHLQEENIECSIVGNQVRAVFTFWMDEAVKKFTAYSISSIGMFFADRSESDPSVPTVLARE